mmetsp:Transcript_3503/g.6190  ORF Transcript_3503/g.6190 Transcript_3503/m.6190 type:complete len:607 (+) Transcript_3503:53-1873(+)
MAPVESWHLPTPIVPNSSLPTLHDQSLPPGWVQADAPGWGKDGQQLHGMSSDKEGSVPITSWCITFQDLVFLRKCIKKAIAEGEIRPTERDQFDVNEDVVGPNMYTACEQYIKPLTEKAGSMSWALMRHPEGIPCDLFITHGWIEGIFEFVDKVLNSWPYGKKACYVCMLSNPQNLDISSLIRSPRESPFALCLECASHMLVVPNHYVSIYSRLWCVYEAFLAFQHRKVIFTATPPIRYTLMKHMAVLAVPFTAGLIAGLAGGMGECQLFDNGMTLPVSILLAIIAKFGNLLDFPELALHETTKLWLRYPMLYAAILLGVFVSSMGLAIATQDHALDCWPKYVANGVFYVNEQWTFYGSLVVSWTLVAYFVGCEVDRVLQCQSVTEAKQLTYGFTHVSRAGCSNEDDATRIKDEVSEEMSKVDHAVVVLRAAGMSTHSLRAAEERGVDITGAGQVSISNLCFAICFWISMQVIYLAIPGLSAGFLAAWVVLNLCVLACYLAAYCMAMPDQRAFAISVSSKVWLLALLFLRFWTSDASTLTPEYMAKFLGFGIATSSFGAILLSYLGMSGIAKVPGIGPLLAALLGPRCACMCCKRRRNQVAAISDD